MHHSECCTEDAQDSLQQLRVIDCGSKTVVLAPVGCQYVALSYVWGQLNDAFDDLQDPPKTIADSFHITRLLGYKYLWIDRFVSWCHLPVYSTILTTKCINQNDHIDKHRQVRQMGDIYSAAQVTLVVAAGSDASYGLPGVMSKPRFVPKAEKIGTTWLKLLPRRIKLAEVAESKWASRGWTFQEFYRSRRRLIFTEHQVIFMCNSQIRYKIALSGINWPGPDSPSTEDGYWARRWLPHCGVAKDLKSIWTAIDRAAGHLQAYSNRNLTYDSDSLDAIAGALDSLRKDSVHHIWGALFRHTAPRAKANQHSVLGRTQQTDMALTWYHQKRARRRPGFPSWSSLGWEGPIIWHRWWFDEKESPIVLSNARRARLHFPASCCDLLNFDPAQQESIDSTPPRLELTLRTAKLDLVIYGNQSHEVELELSAHYKYALIPDWDADPISLSAKSLVGALLHGWGGKNLEAFVLVLAPCGDVLARVGLVHLPRSRDLLRVDHVRNGSLPIHGYSDRKAANEFLQSYSSDYGAWWKNIFGDYRTITIG